MLGEARPRLQHVQLRRRLDRPLQIAGPRAERVGEREENTPNLFVLLLLERDDVVVDLDRAERLEEKARAARRRAVHHAGNVAAMLALDDEHVAAVPPGDHLILAIPPRPPAP